MTTLFQELKRRNVIRVAAAYVVVSWLLLQIGDVLFEALKLDDGALTILLAIIAIGFIPVVVFAWVYELTPEGIKREAEIDETTSIAHQTGRKLNIITLVTMVILIALIFWDRNFAPVPRVEPVQNAEDITTGPSIAVLPFQDMSVQGDQEYFGDGIAEELLNVLAKTDGLRVAARTSSFTFKGNQTDIREIGAALDVKTVLEGSIRKDGDNIRVTAQLINVADGYHIWSDSFDRKLNNIFQVQDEIALSIVDALKLKLDLGNHHREGISSEAYDLYLRGRDAARTIDKPNQLKAVEYFEQAIAIEPNFPEAHAGLASSWIWLEDYGGFAADFAYPIIAKAARRALQLDTSNSEALMAMALYFNSIDDDKVMAKTLFEYALKENPSLVPIYFHYSDILENEGKLKEAIEYRKRAVELDPLSTFYRSRLVFQLHSLGQTEEALEQLEIIFTQSPEDTHGFEERANIYYQTGELAKSVLDYQQVHVNRPGDAYSAGLIAMVMETLDLTEKTNKWLQEARFRGEDNRWELRARANVAMLRQDWQTLLEVGKIKTKSDRDIGNSYIGYAQLQLGNYEQAREIFASVFKDINYPAKPVSRIMNSNVFALFGQVLLDDLTGQPSEYYDAMLYSAKLVSQTSDYFDHPDLSSHYVQACLTMFDKRLNLNEKKGLVKEQLEKAINTGFRELSKLDQVHCFDPIRDTEEFKAIYERIQSLNTEQRELLIESGFTN